MRRTAISTRGRVTIPADLRERLGIKPGTQITWHKEEGRLVLTPTKRRLNKFEALRKKSTP